MPGLAQGSIFTTLDGRLLKKNGLREAHERALKRAGITHRFTVHGLRRTFNNLARQVAGEIVTRSITGHVTAQMTEHYSFVDRAEKLAAAGKVVQMVFGNPVGDPVGDRRDATPATEGQEESKSA